MRSSHRALVGFNNLLIHLIFEGLNEYLCLKYVAHPSKWRVEPGASEVLFFVVLEEIVYSFFNFPFAEFWNSIYLTYEP